jgi:hypothetical protein
MDIASHLEKVKRFERVRNRLDPMKDFELWYWMSLSAGTSAVNGALHASGLTDDGDYFCTQSVDVYLRDGRHDKPDSWKSAFMWDVDIIHVHMPEISKSLTPELKKAYKAMGVLEEVRDPCVRADKKVTKKIVDAVDKAYKETIKICTDIIKDTEKHTMTTRKSTAAKSAKKTTAKRAPAKRKSAAAKSTAKRTTAKKPVAKKAVAKKPAAKKAAVKKIAAKKTTARKPAATKAAVKKVAAKKTTARKPAAKKATVKKVAAKKTTARKPAAKKTAAKKAPARKPAAKK